MKMRMINEPGKPSIFNTRHRRRLYSLTPLSLLATLLAAALLHRLALLGLEAVPVHVLHVLVVFLWLGGGPLGSALRGVVRLNRLRARRRASAPQGIGADLVLPLISGGSVGGPLQRLVPRADDGVGT